MPANRVDHFPGLRGTRSGVAADSPLGAAELDAVQGGLVDHLKAHFPVPQLAAPKTLDELVNMATQLAFQQGQASVIRYIEALATER